MLYEYKTVQEQGKIEIVEKKSRFIANVKPVQTEEEAQQYINELKTKYWDARHNVYAYIIGANDIQRYSDDGEPSGTAGIPTLEVLKKEGVQDVVIIITRYFGGTLLGAGGLVRAYSKSAKEGLIDAGIVTMKLVETIKIVSDYHLFGKIQNEVIDQGHSIKDVIYEEAVIIYINVDIQKSDEFIKYLIDKTNARVDIEKIATEYQEMIK